MTNRISYLESLMPAGSEEKHFDQFERFSTYMGNGVYQWLGILSANLRELFLMGCLHKEGINYERE